MNMFAQFHFLRPWWLLLLIPALTLALLLWRQRSSGANWRRAIAPELIDYLIEPAREQQRRWPWLVLVAWSLAIVAIAGPAWEKMPQPVLQKRDGLVIVLDLSLSMYAQDIQPSRLQRARYKVLDILQRRHEGLTGLVVYSGDAHVVTPLTDDTATIANLVPALSPTMMPNFGSDPAAALDLAVELLRNAGFERGRVLLLSDEISSDNIEDIASRFSGKPWQLSIIGVGSEQGAPIPLPQQSNTPNRSGTSPQNNSQKMPSGFVKQQNGTIAIAQLHRGRFVELANKIGARYSDIRLDDSDLDATLPNTLANAADARVVERKFDLWRERGPQLVWLLLPLAALAFRRGWLLAVLLLPLSTPSQALDWPTWARQLWQTPDQSAQQQFDAGNEKAAAQTFRDPAWRGAAQYRAGDYQEAAQTLSTIDTADAHYNRGNALAHAGKLPDAIAAYDAALKMNPQMEDAKANRELIEKLLKQQQKRNPAGDSKNQSSQNKHSDSSGQQSESSSQQSQSSSQQSDDSQPQNKQPSDMAKQQNSSGADKNSEQSKIGSDKNDQHPENQRAAAQQKNADVEKAIDNSLQPETTPQQPTTAQSPQTSEQQLQQRATEQWLRQIPDDPSGLLRRKFQYESRQRERDTAPRPAQPQW